MQYKKTAKKGKAVSAKGAMLTAQFMKGKAKMPPKNEPEDRIDKSSDENEGQS